ncbi:threonyl-tRNA synthetase editing domain-containing protein [Candidatus Bipolaricaulota bacterium]|nr:threonyl-tRNA synthetase editing domain-containing protein [Candidatus Bipolaricaulota bacterium]
MKLLMIYAERFSYKTTLKTLDSEEDRNEEKAFEGALVGFIHVEPQDEERGSAVETHLIKLLKWAARKNETQRIVLHSFAHLAEEKGSAEFTKKLLDGAQARLVKSGYEALQTPFGFFLDLHVDAPGHPLARIFKSV